MQGMHSATLCLTSTDSVSQIPLRLDRLYAQSNCSFTAVTCVSAHQGPGLLVGAQR